MRHAPVLRSVGLGLLAILAGCAGSRATPVDPLVGSWRFGPALEIHYRAVVFLPDGRFGLLHEDEAGYDESMNYGRWQRRGERVELVYDATICCSMAEVEAEAMQLLAPTDGGWRIAFRQREGLLQREAAAPAGP